MKQQALRTAMTLYDEGTQDLETAARRAGVSPERLRLAVERTGSAAPSPAVETGQVSVGAD